jgi:excinuclease ABC subunit A
VNGRRDRTIAVRGAAEHNLKGIDVTIPRDQLVVVTGVSGSGKSSLAFDTIFREGQRRFLETLPSYARSFMGGLTRPRVAGIEGLGPAIALGQRVGLGNPRSTVGTMTEVWDLLRLLFARLGTSDAGLRPTRALFSFNGDEGACPACQGLGLEDRLDPDSIIADPTKSLRDGALRVSTPNGYLMYSQVTLAVLDQVLRAHGGDVDTPWRELGEEARRVVFHGSRKLEVPFGKHPLESRMRWTGITPRPRQVGFYRGLVPVMEEILRGKRNDSILRFVRTTTCSACGGTRLRPEALSVRWRDQTIAGAARMRAGELREWLAGAGAVGREAAVLDPIRADVLARCDLMLELGLGYLGFDRAADTLSVGEGRRLRLLTLALGELRGLVVVLDEPSAGLHPHDTGRLVEVLRRIRDRGQTVLVVEHDPLVARAADWLVELGPGPGRLGGELLWSGPPGARSGERTGWGRAATAPRPARPKREGGGLVPFAGLRRNNLADVEVALLRGGLNLVTGLSGAGKSSLLAAIAERAAGDGGAVFRRVVTVDAQPIGRTPRSNAATYSGVFDAIRDSFAATAEARARSLGKGHFSFNTAGGRCETCEGAGRIEVGMRYLGAVDLPCDACGGRRFHPEVLEVLYRGRSIADVLELSVAEAADLFADHAKVARILGALADAGLGYLGLGQAATTLSGGEAQRVKLATELAKAGKGAALIVLDEPSTGLHEDDIAGMLGAWDRLLDAGHTLLAADNDLVLVRAADRVIDVGPGAGPEGGRIVFQGPGDELARCGPSLTGACLRAEATIAGPAATGPRAVSPQSDREPPEVTARRGAAQTPMSLRGVRTHNLRGIDVELPSPGLTVVTGPSGSGKSSLVFDTLLAEAQNRFADLVAPWARRFLPKRGGADLDVARELRAAVAVPQHAGRRNPRSTVGTVSELDELLRLLYSRAGTGPCPACGRPRDSTPCACGARPPALWAGAFSPNTQAGACPRCRGLGFVQQCDPTRLVAHPERALRDGALDGSRFGAYLGEADGQHLAILSAAAAALGVDASPPWSALSEAARALALDGAGDRVFDVAWEYKRGRREGVHRFTAAWPGLLALVEREHERLHADARGEALEELMRDAPCPECRGERLRPEPRAVGFAGQRLPEVGRASLVELRAWLEAIEREPGRLGVPPRALAVSAELRRDLRRRLGQLVDAGLGYLSPDREVATLSGGELQRLRLAAALGGGLVGVTYVLDEPTQGLHPRDVARLAGVLRSLADAGNAVVVVEHDATLAARADWIVELGPGSGPAGGRLTAQGAPARLPAESYTARLLRRERRAAAREPRVPMPGATVRGARLHNLRDLTVSFPAGALVAVTGVSGSGKSTLVHGVLGPSLEARLKGEGAVGCAAFELGAALVGVESLRQAVPAAAGRSTVATVGGVADALRQRFAATAEAKARRLTARHFSTAVPGGRCEACEGRGVVTIAMDLLPDVKVGCEACGGRRFVPEVLACTLRGYDVAELLEAPLGEVRARFEDDSGVATPLAALVEIGLGYLHLGQEASELSAGELQRLRLAIRLARSGVGPVAVLLDEPTRGLGFEDVDRLVAALHRLADQGHLVVVVEHDFDLIAAADWVIDLGPEGGDGGGTVVVAGPPALVRATDASHTGRALRSRG